MGADNSFIDKSGYKIKVDAESVIQVVEFAKEIGIANVNFDKLQNNEVLLPFLSQLRKLKDKYGVLFNSISAEITSNADIAWVTPSKQLIINADYFNSKEMMNKVIKDFIQKGILPKGADINYIATHEWGHYISMDDLADIKSPMNALFRRTKPKDFVSKNATKDSYEFVADNIAKNICIGSCKTSNKVVEYYLKERR